MNGVTSLLSMRGMLLGNRFEPKPKSHALGTVGSVMTYGFFFSVARPRRKKRQFDERKQD